MTNDTQTKYFVLQKGAVQEEAWEWADIEEMCRVGHLSRDCLIFMPEDNAWKKAIETRLAPLFENLPPVEEAASATEDEAKLEEDYQLAVEQIHESANDWNAVVHAAELAILRGDRETATEHFQQALNSHPYHPRIVQEARKSLHASECQGLRYLEKSPSVWDDLVALFKYPLSRGPLYLAVPAAALWVILWIPFVNVLLVPLLALWGVAIISSCARDEKSPPLWHGVLADPRGAVIKPLVMLGFVAAELYLPVYAILKTLVVTGVVSEPGVLLFIQKNPLLSVPMATISLIYLPAVLVVASVPHARVSRILNPKAIVGVIRDMEREYIMATGFVILTFCLWAGLTALFTLVPILGHLLSVALGVYIWIAVGFVLGRLRSRFSEDLADAFEA